MYVDLIDVTEIYAEKEKALAEEQKRLAVVASNVAFAVSGPLQNAYETYTGTMVDFTGKQGDLMLQMRTLLDQGYSPESQALLDLQREYKTLNGDIDDASEALSRATAEMIFQQASANLDGEALLELGRAMGVISETDYNLAKTIGEINTLFDANKDGVINAAEANDGYIQALKDLQTAAADGKLTLEEVKLLMDSLDGRVANAEVVVATSYPNGIPYIPGDVPSGGGSGGSTATPGDWYPSNATGGVVYAGQASIIGETGWEAFIPAQDGRILSNQEAKEALAGGGGGDTINYYIYNPLAAKMALDQTRQRRTARANALM
jgi:hypothetical protein